MTWFIVSVWQTASHVLPASFHTFADNRDPKAPAAELAITFYVVRPDRSAVPLWTKEYRRRTPLTAVSAASYAAAQSAALGEILAELARDLATERTLR